MELVPLAYEDSVYSAKISLDFKIKYCYMSRVMRKPVFCICKNKDADQLRGNREADQRLCFHYTDSAIPLHPKSKFQASRHLLWLYSPVYVDLVGNPEDRFSHNDAHIALNLLFI